MQHKTLFISILTALGLTFGGAAIAQEEYQQEYDPQQQQQQEAPDVSDEDLEKFAKAEQNVRTVQEDYSTQLQEAEDPNKQQELQQEANEEMRAAVSDAGLDVQTYNEISMAIQQDPELRERYEELQQS